MEEIIKRAEQWVEQTEQRLTNSQVVAFDDMEEALEVIDSLLDELKQAERQIALLKAMLEGR